MSDDQPVAPHETRAHEQLAFVAGLALGFVLCLLLLSLTGVFDHVPRETRQGEKYWPPETRR